MPRERYDAAIDEIAPYLSQFRNDEAARTAARQVLTILDAADAVCDNYEKWKREFVVNGTDLSTPASLMEAAASQMIWGATAAHTADILTAMGAEFPSYMSRLEQVVSDCNRNSRNSLTLLGVVIEAVPKNLRDQVEAKIETLIKEAKEESARTGNPPVIPASAING